MNPLSSSKTDIISIESDLKGITTAEEAGSRLFELLTHEERRWVEPLFLDRQDEGLIWNAIQVSVIKRLSETYMIPTHPDITISDFREVSKRNSIREGGEQFLLADRMLQNPRVVLVLDYNVGAEGKNYYIPTTILALNDLPSRLMHLWPTWDAARKLSARSLSNILITRIGREDHDVFKLLEERLDIEEFADYGLQSRALRLFINNECFDPTRRLNLSLRIKEAFEDMDSYVGDEMSDEHLKLIQVVRKIYNLPDAPDNWIEEMVR